MDARLWESISSKYVLKEIFSYLKVIKALQILKTSKKLRNIYEIKLFHYQLCSFFAFFKNIKIESIKDILYSPYLEIYPEDVKYKLILKLMEKRKLFDEYIFINYNDNKLISFIRKIKEIMNKDFKYIIVDNEDIKSRFGISCSSKMLGIDDINIDDKILFNYSYLLSYKDSSYNNKNNNMYNLDIKKIRYIHITRITYFNSELDLSAYDNLERLSFLVINGYIGSNIIKLKFTDNQFKNMKALIINEPIEECYRFGNIDFENINYPEENIFQNLEELSLKYGLLSKIHFNPVTLKKLKIIYDFREIKYANEYIQDSINDIIQKYSSIINLNIYLYFKLDEINLNQEMIDYIFNLNHNKESISFNLYYLYQTNEGYEIKSELLIKNLHNKKTKYIIKGKNIEINMIEPYFDKIEEIDLFLNNNKINHGFLYLEENDSISSLTKLRIKSYNFDNILFIPLKSFSSLNVLQLEMNVINFKKEFPLFSKISTVKFDNLEYLKICSDNALELIPNLLDNFNIIPNLRYLLLFSKNMSNTDYPYHKEIIVKCKFLKKLHTLIINSDTNYYKLEKVEIYYPIYPELKNTNIKFCNIYK